MRRFVVGLLATIGALVVLLIIGGALAWHFLAPRAPVIAASTILDLDLTKPLAKGPEDHGLRRLIFEEQLTLRDALDALQRSAGDPRVKGMIARLGNDEMGSATVQELRAAVAAFRAKGKFAIAFADTFGEFGPGSRAYYLATAFDEIWLQPLGQVGLTGLRLESPYLRGLFDIVGVVPRLDHRSEYKSAMNMLTDREMSGPEREEDDALLKSVFGQIVRDIAASRQIAEGDLRRVVDGGPYLAEEASTLRLVDHIGYRDEAIAAARSRAGGIAALLHPLPYLERAGRPNLEGPTIALIYATGLITRGGDGESPLGDGATLGADAVARAFRAALADPQVRAILFRIDSPGGSAVASETIWREVVRARHANIPVIVSMGDVAGSGGYYIATAADKIVAEPATLTGSIGVVAGKFLTSGAWSKLGVTWGAVQTGQNAGMFSTLEDFTPQGQRRFQAFLDAVYSGFKAHVESGRKLDKDTVEQIARGRVWSGEDAKQRGLVDELGGYETALRLAKLAAHLNADASVTLKQYPPERGAREQLLAKLLGRDTDDEAQVTAETALPELAQLITVLRPALRAVDALTMPPGSVTMPDIEAR